MSVLEDLRVLEHYIEHSFADVSSLSSECKRELRSAIASLAETFLSLERRIYDLEHKTVALTEGVKVLSERADILSERLTVLRDTTEKTQ